MADYTKEMKALEGLMDREQGMEMAERDRYSRGVEMAGILSPISKPSKGAADILSGNVPVDRSAEMMATWTTSPAQGVEGAVSRQKNLLEKYKSLQDLQTKSDALSFQREKFDLESGLKIEEKNQKSMQDYVKQIDTAANRTKEPRENFEQVRRSYMNVQSVLNNRSASGEAQFAALAGFLKAVDPRMRIQEGNIDLASSGMTLLQSLGLKYGPNVTKGMMVDPNFVKELEKTTRLILANEKDRFEDIVANEFELAEASGVPREIIQTGIVGISGADPVSVLSKIDRRRGNVQAGKEQNQQLENVMGSISQGDGLDNLSDEDLNNELGIK
jgi:hypothetical protein